MEWKRGNFSINDDKSRIDLEVVSDLLKQSYWAPNRSQERMNRAIAQSLCFNLCLAKNQIGFARVVTDRSTFAWICDVIIHPSFRGQGLGTWLMSCIINHPFLEGTQITLKTKDAHTFYERFGFELGDCMTRRG